MDRYEKIVVGVADSLQQVAAIKNMSSEDREKAIVTARRRVDDMFANMLDDFSYDEKADRGTVFSQLEGIVNRKPVIDIGQESVLRSLHPCAVPPVVLWAAIRILGIAIDPNLPSFNAVANRYGTALRKPDMTEHDDFLKRARQMPVNECVHLIRAYMRKHKLGWDLVAEFDRLGIKQYVLDGMTSGEVPYTFDGITWADEDAALVRFLRITSYDAGVATPC